MRRVMQREQTKQKLQQVAIELFQKQGYPKTTVSQITEEAGVAKGTFFNYFKSKEEVLHVLGEKQNSLIEKHMKELLQSKQSIKYSIREFFQLLVKTNEEANPQLVRSLFHISIINEAFHEYEVLQVEQLMKQLILLIDEGKRRELFTTNLSSEKMASLMITQFYGILLYWCTYPHKSISLGEEVECSITSLFYGFVNKAFPNN